MTEDPAVQIIATALAASWATDTAADVNVDAEAVAAALRAAGYLLNPDEVSRPGERQIREAFIDGFLSGRGGNGDAHRPDAERAWRDENVTHPDPAGEVSVPVEALRNGHDSVGCRACRVVSDVLARLDPSPKENA